MAARKEKKRTKKSSISPEVQEVLERQEVRIRELEVGFLLMDRMVGKKPVGADAEQVASAYIGIRDSILARFNRANLIGLSGVANVD